MNITKLILALLFSSILCACGGGGGGSDDDDNTNEMAAEDVMDGEMMDEEMMDDGMMDDGMMMAEEEMMDDEMMMEEEMMEDPMMMEAGVDGTYSGIGTFVTSITVRNTAEMNMDPPLVATCTGDIETQIDSSTMPEVTGSGSCLTDSNAATYMLTATLTSATEFSGEIVFEFSGVTHTVPLSGSVDGGTVSATFMGTTPQTAQIVIDWDGSFTADLTM